MGNLNRGGASRNANGKLVLTAGALSNQGNWCGGALASCVMASGSNIYSLGKNSQMATAGGTSMAAPLVSGVAALVAQKYPFLGGKQLADVILSTANKDYEFPKVFIKGPNIIYVDNPKPTTEEEIRKDLTAAYNKNMDKAKIENGLSNVLEKSREDIFGQGIVDAESAMKGLKTIDINRLQAGDADSKTAFYTLDTQNYNALFENDIDQKKYDAKYHSDTNQPDPSALKNTDNAGFKKKGAGTLGLTGNLNYEGKTIIEQGGIDLIGKQNQEVKGSGIEVKSGAQLFVGTSVKAENSEITNQGDITIGTDAHPQHLKAKTLTNQGTLTLGDTPHSTEHLELSGKFTQEEQGTLNAGYLSIGDGKATNRAIKATDYDVKGTVNYMPISASALTQAVPLSLNGMESKMSDATINVRSAAHALSYVVTTGGGVATLSVLPIENIYADFDGSNISLAKVLVPMSDSASTLSDDYDTFFRALNATQYDFYKEALLALDDVSHLENNALLMDLNSQEVLESIDNLQSGIQGAFLRPRFTHIQKGNLNGRRIGFDIIANKQTPVGLGSAFVRYDHLSGDLSSQMASAGAALKTPFSWFGVFGGARLGWAKNSIKTNQAAPLNYNTFSGNVFAGVDASITLNALPQTQIIPTFYVDVQHFRQQSIRHPGVSYRGSPIFNSIANSGYVYSGKSLFARQINAHNSNLVSANVGLNVRQVLSHPWRLNVYAFFERRLNAKELTTWAQLDDFPGQFSQGFKLNQNHLRLGLNADYQAPVNAKGIVYYATIGIHYETSIGANKNNQYRAYGADFKGGMRF